MDKNGYLWNARWGAVTLDCMAPSGRLFLSLNLPFTQPSCPAFVGKQAQGMLVTSASITLSDDNVQGKSALYSGEFEGVVGSAFLISFFAPSRPVSVTPFGAQSSKPFKTCHTALPWISRPKRDVWSNPMPAAHGR